MLLRKLADVALLVYPGASVLLGDWVPVEITEGNRFESTLRDLHPGRKLFFARIETELHSFLSGANYHFEWLSFIIGHQIQDHEVPFADGNSSLWEPRECHDSSVLMECHVWDATDLLCFAPTDAIEAPLVRLGFELGAN